MLDDEVVYMGKIADRAKELSPREFQRTIDNLITHKTRRYVLPVGSAFFDRAVDLADDVTSELQNWLQWNIEHAIGLSYGQFPDSWPQSIQHHIGQSVVQVYKEQKPKFRRTGFLWLAKEYVQNWPMVTGFMVGLYEATLDEQTEYFSKLRPQAPREPPQSPEEFAGERVPRKPILPELGVEAEVPLLIKR